MSNNTFALVIAMVIIAMMVLACGPSIPECQEDEALARRPYPEGELRCWNLEELAP